MFGGHRGGWGVLQWPAAGHPRCWAWAGTPICSDSLSSPLNVSGVDHLQIRLWKYTYPHFLNDKAFFSFFFFSPDSPRHLWFLHRQEPSDNRRAAFLQDMAYANCSLNGFACPSCWIPQSSSCWLFSKDKSSATMTGRLFHKDVRSCAVIISDHWTIFFWAFPT